MNLGDDKKMNIVFKSSLERLTELNSSFDSGVLRVAYVGKNRNKSYISKETFEKYLKTIYNCPIVCNYNRELNSIGAHDMEIVSTDDGMKLVNLTTPVGVVPESARTWFEFVTEDDGSVHEYLYTDVIIWKRQEAYEKIKENGITDESMEIRVKSGKTIDGYYHIDSFEFTAFCLLESAEPCYESASLEMFSLKSFHDEYTKMMEDFKESFRTVTPSTEDDIQHNLKIQSKGGSISLERMELLTEYGLTVEELDFNIDDFTVEELRAKFEAMNETAGSAGSGDDSEEPNTEASEDNAGANPQGGALEGAEETFTLTGEQFLSELIEALAVITCIDPYWGEVSRYNYIDYDPTLFEVYCYDWEDFKLYGFSYSMNGDKVIVDFDSRKRKKTVFVDFDEGSGDSGYAFALKAISEKFAEIKNAEINSVSADLNEKFNQAETTISTMKSELDSLREFKQACLDAERESAENELFERFAELDGIEAFEELKSNHEGLDFETLENKCFEIKGRNASLNFSVQKPISTRLPVEKHIETDEPYGGAFIKYRSK